MDKKQSAQKNRVFEGLILFLMFVFPFLGYLPHPTLLLTAIVTVAEIFWLWGRIKEGKLWLSLTRLDLCVLLLALAFLISGALTGGAFGEGIVRALLLLCYFPTADFFRCFAWRRRGAFAAQFAGGIAAFLGTFQYILGKAQLKWVDLDRFSDIGGRVTGGFENPNVFSIYLLLIFPFSLVELFKDSTPFYARVFSFLCLVPELFCLVLTWSRGAWLSAVCVTFVFFIAFGKRTRRYLAVGALPLLILSLYLPHNIVNRFQSIGNLRESSIRYRLLVWEGVWRMICEHPLGIGLGQARFSERYLPYAVKGTETVIHSHQIFFQILCELGMIGTLIFLLLLVTLLYRLFSSQNGDPLCRFGGGLGVLGAMIAGLFDNVWYHFGVFCFFWITVAFASSCEKCEKKALQLLI